MSNIKDNSPVIFFDGHCNLCTWSVIFVIKRDKNKHFKFTSLQSNFAKTSLPKEIITKQKEATIILSEKSVFSTESSAILNIIKNLNGIWPILYFFIIIPKPIRDFIYKLISKNRYRWFGVKDQCYVPTENIKDRFLTD